MILIYCLNYLYYKNTDSNYMKELLNKIFKAFQKTVMIFLIKNIIINNKNIIFTYYIYLLYLFIKFIYKILIKFYYIYSFIHDNPYLDTKMINLFNY